MIIPCIKMENCIQMPVKKPIGYLAEREYTADEVKKVEVLANKQSELEDGEIGLFQLNGEILLKSYMYVDGKVTLLEPNQNPIEVKQSDNFEIIGKALKYHISFI